MSEINSLHQFFSEINCHYQCYNLGRRIHPLARQDFIDFEHTGSAWQAPFLQHAWLALVFWKETAAAETTENKQPQQHVWFLKLPLDEQAKLNLAARDDFLRRLFTALGDHLTSIRQAESGAQLNSVEGAMQDNPYGFQPKEEQMANFHAIVHQQLELPASAFYKDTQNYLSNKQNFQQWQHLGLQGFADLAARLHEENNEQLINSAIADLPIEPLQVLGSCLENQRISKHTTQAVYQRLSAELEHYEQANNTPATALLQLCISAIRATAQTEEQSLQIQLLSRILSTEIKTDIEILATISGRCWPLTAHAQILPLFLDALALADTQHPGAFKAVISDLMFIPGMRDTILQAFRSAQRSPHLAQAIGAFFNNIA